MERKPEKLPLWRIFALCAVGGAIDLGYAIEGAYAAPLMLDSGLPLILTSIAFLPSPVLSLITQLFLGTVSDNCTCSWGRRRPFIVFFCLTTVASLLLAPNVFYLTKAGFPKYVVTVAVVFFIVLFDYSLNVLRVPSRAYVMDVLPLSQSQLGGFVYSAMIGVGATIGFILGGIDWLTVIQRKVSITHQCQVVFGIIAAITLLCMFVNICSVKETPFRPKDSENMLSVAERGRETSFNEDGSDDRPSPELVDECDRYDYSEDSGVAHGELTPSDSIHGGSKMKRSHDKSRRCCSSTCISDFKRSFMQILEFVYHISGYMWLLLLFTFLVAIVNAFENFFTLFVGRGVFGGVEDAPIGSDSLMRYNIGVRVGSWGLAIAAASDVVTSLVLSPITRVVRLKTVFMLILTLFVISMVLMMTFRRVEVVLALSVFYGPMLGLAVTIPFGLIPFYEVSFST